MADLSRRDRIVLLSGSLAVVPPTSSSSERWHEVHDAFVAENGDEARAEAVRRADEEVVFEPGARWVVEDPNFVQVFRNPYTLSA